MRAFIDALISTLILAAFVAILVTAPSWGAWLDRLGEPDHWERAAADRHADLLEKVRCQ